MKCRRRNCTSKGIRPGQLCTKHYRVTPHGFIDAGPAQEHVKALRAAGYGWEELAKLTGLSARALRLVGKWTEQNTVCLDTYERIIAVPIPDGFVHGNALVPAIGTKRRIQALMAMGWTQTLLAQEMGLKDQKQVSDLTRRREWVFAVSAAKVAQGYERLHMVPGPSGHLRKRAKTWGFAPPLAWENIDDPDEVPNIGAHTRTTASERIAELYDIGVRDVHRIAERLQIKKESVERQLYPSRAAS